MITYLILLGRATTMDKVVVLQYLVLLQINVFMTEN